MDRRESDLSSFTRLKANRQIWTDRSGHPPLPTVPQICYSFFPFFFRGKNPPAIKYFPEIGERKKKRYIYIYIRIFVQINIWRNLVHVSMEMEHALSRSGTINEIGEIGERFNLSRGTNPCYRDISIIGRYIHGDGLYSKLIIDDTSRGLVDNQRAWLLAFHVHDTDRAKLRKRKDRKMERA